MCAAPSNTETSRGPTGNAARSVPHVTCLGCGCACDDIVIRTDGQRIVDAENACRRGIKWFGDGSVPDQVLIDGASTSLDDAVEASAALLMRARQPLVFLAPELSCEAQRDAIAIADTLRATLDTTSSATVLPSILAVQERGRAGATLGEIRNRADLLVFWGVDPADRYSRYRSRVIPTQAGLYVGERSDRVVMAVDIGDHRGPTDADARISIDPQDEVATLTALQSLLTGEDRFPDDGPWANARLLLEQAKAARYAVIVTDGEPSPDDRHTRDRGRTAALVAATQALNHVTRAALSTLRGGGNRVGAETVLTAQTGYPARVDFSTGYPRYCPLDAPPAPDVVLIVGDRGQLPANVADAVEGISTIVIGPRASAAQAAVAIDTGMAGIHEAGTAVRLDDVPLPLRPSLSARETTTVLRALQARLLAGAEALTPSPVPGPLPPSQQLRRTSHGSRPTNSGASTRVEP